MIKIVGSELVRNVAERAMRVHGAMGLSNQTPLADVFSQALVFTIADGPTEVHLPTISRMELKSHNPDDFEKFYNIAER